MASYAVRRVSELVREVEERRLVLSPEFQRRLVWTNVVKDDFLDTVLNGFPFPEIFIATGAIDTKTQARTNLLVDGQQRVSTLREYVQGSSDLVLKKTPSYESLSEEGKQSFLDYEVAVRDLGTVSEDQIKEIFRRINSTDYALRAMERLNAQFSGEYKAFCDELSRDEFFARHGIFSLADFRRMRDLDFCVILVTTLLSTYYHRDSLNEEYLRRYNDDFTEAKRVSREIQRAFRFIEDCIFDKKCRVWKKTDLFTLIVEVHAIQSQGSQIDLKKASNLLSKFYAEVDAMYKMEGSDEELERKSPNPGVFRYLKASTKATNDKYARVDRAEVISKILEGAIAKVPRRKIARKNNK